jgi:gliding motility-associated-like protein
MKQVYFVTVLLLGLVCNSNVFAGTTYPVCPAPTSIPSGCAQALPFCTGSTYTFPNTTGTGNQGALECLGSTPNPTWYYLEIATAGDIDIFISQVNGSGTGIDVDFALLGPYSSVAAGCANPASGCVEDCSFSTSATETANIVGAQVGEIYLLLLTNFSNQSGTITFSQTGGNGATDCSILEPSCQISALTAIPSTCANNLYSVSGQMTLSNPPSTGTLTVSNSCGGSQVFNAPFTSPVNYSLTGLNPTGGVCTVSATFSVDTDCTASIGYSAPSIPVVSAGPDVNICQDNPITLSGSGASTYSWTGGITNDISFIPSSGSTLYTVTGTNAAGCTSTDEVLVVVTTSPVVSAGTYPAVCADAASVALTGTPAGGTFSGTGVTGNSFDPAFGTQVLTYDYTDANGCSGSATSTITVNPLPAVNAGSDVSICSGAEIPLSGTGTGTPTWSPSSGLSSTNSFTPLASPSATTTYTLTVNQGGCISSDQMTVFVSSPADLVITSDLSLCPGECADINVSGASYYLWNPSPDISDPTQPSFNVCPSTTTTYTVTGYVPGASAVINGDFSGGSVGFTSDYSLNPDTQTEGTYFVTTNANLTHPGFTGVDHTTGTGNFLVVNGSSTPNSSVWCQTITVQPNTDYVFSTWVSTLAVGSPAILQFSINGSTLATPFTAPSVTGVWDEFYATWNSGANTTATICIVNQNTSLGGNDFGLDDIFFAALCSSTASVTVTVHPNASISGGADVTVCEGTTVTLNGLGGVSYLWNNGGTDGQPFTPSLGAMVFTVTGTDANGCVGTDDVTVTAVPVPNANLEADVQSGFPGLQVNFTNSSTAATNYSWVFGNSQYTTSTTLDGQSMTYNGSGTYVVQLIADNGYCTDTDTVHILIFPLPDPIVYIPNVFTPNADGSNDFWMIDTEYASSIQITILNRWGNVVAEIEELNGNWDGTSNGNEATDGVYFFKYVVVGINGTELTGHGNITLIR